MQGGIKLRQQFPAFPGGRYGVALLLLRFVLALTGIADGLACFAGRINLESQIFGALLTAAGVMLLLGLFTASAAVGIAVATVSRELLPLPIPPSAMFPGAAAAGVPLVLGISLALLGPGIFSIDFKLFGHREIVIPRRIHD